MNIKRVLLGGHPNPIRKKIPDAIEERKTIKLNIFDVLLIFPDRTPDARAWIEEVVPTLMIGRKEEILDLFWSMDKSSWWEFDYGRKTLHLCSIEK
jgi:hypothetical protein